MPNINDQELEKTIELIANESKVMAMALTVRQIQIIVMNKIGREPSTSTVTRILRRIGIDTSKAGGHKWVYKHKASHE